MNKIGKETLKMIEKDISLFFKVDVTFASFKR